MFCARCDSFVSREDRDRRKGSVYCPECAPGTAHTRGVACVRCGDRISNEQREWIEGRPYHRRCLLVNRP